MIGICVGCGGRVVDYSPPLRLVPSKGQVVTVRLNSPRNQLVCLRCGQVWR